MAKEFTVYVPVGSKVNVEELKDLSLGDKRIPSDRDVVLQGPEDLKLAVSRVGEQARASASVITMCG